MRSSVVAFIMMLYAAAAGSLQAQEPAGEAEVRAVVMRLFDGMRARDTVAIASVFHSEARLHGIGREGGIEVMAAADFVRSIASAPAGLLLDEVLQDIEVRIDGPLATIWTYYDFFAGETFSHCGYNAFQLLNGRDGWQVVAVTDSRRREGCRRHRS
jgi:hypothetical protein